MTSSSLALGGPVSSMDEAVDRMQQIDAALPAADGLACFNRMYLEVTKQVQAEVTPGLFAEPPFCRRLDVVFANLYFAAVDAAGQDAGQPAGRLGPAARDPCRCGDLPDPVRPGWHERPHQSRPANRRWSRPAPTWTPPWKRAAITPTTRRSTPSSTRAEQSVRQSFESQAARDEDQRAQAVLDLVCNWSINTARDAAWDTALGLWAGT